jgi:NitT/TauT family transport system substrate-binding protein
MESFPVAGYFVTAEFAQQNPNTVAAFANAVQAAADMGNADPTVIHSTVQEYTTLPPELVTELNYPEYHGTLDPQVLQRVYDLMQQFEMIGAGLDVSSLVLSTAR